MCLHASVCAYLCVCVCVRASCVYACVYICVRKRVCACLRAQPKKNLTKRKSWDYTPLCASIFRIHFIFVCVHILVRGCNDKPHTRTHTGTQVHAQIHTLKHSHTHKYRQYSHTQKHTCTHTCVDPGSLFWHLLGPNPHLCCSVCCSVLQCVAVCEK